MKYGSFLIALLLLAAAPASADTIYRWTDDNGVAHFTAHPPKDREFTQVNTRSGRNVHVPTDTARQNTDTPATPEQPEAQQSADEEPCQIARQNLGALEGGGRIRIDGPNGPRFIGEEERLERLEETRTFIADNC